MEYPFTYDTFVTEKQFIGRRSELTVLSNLLVQCENVVLYEPPKSGKKSLIQQTLHNIKLAGNPFCTCNFSLLNVRAADDFILGLGDRVIRSFATTPDEYEALVSEFLAGTHFVFDREAYSATDHILSLNWDIDDDDIRAVVALPMRLSMARNERMYLILDEFQNIMKTPDGDGICRLMENVMKENAESNCAFIFVGSCVNAMIEIFRQRGRFYRMVNHVELSQVDVKDIIDHAVKGFLSSGKVVDRDLLLGASKLFRSNMWYINHFCAIADSLSKGYIMEPILMEALNTLVSIHEPRFRAMINDMTTFQLCLFKAILDGHSKLSSSEVINKYNLSSSANVRRLKDALCKKEIITFDDSDNPVILDPLFEYWAGKYFFAN